MPKEGTNGGGEEGGYSSILRRGFRKNFSCTRMSFSREQLLPLFRYGNNRFRWDRIRKGRMKCIRMDGWMEREEKINKMCFGPYFEAIRGILENYVLD